MFGMWVRVSIPIEVDSMALGSRHMCASDRSRIVCWGSNEYGQLSGGTLWESAEVVEVIGL